MITDIPIASGSSIGLQGLAVNPVTNRIYASDADNGQYIVIDGQSNTVIAQVPVASQPGGIAANPKTDRIYVVGTGFPGLIMVFDGATNTQVASIHRKFRRRKCGREFPSGPRLRYRSGHGDRG